MSRRHRALGLLFGAYALSLFDRQIVNILAPSIKNDFDLSDGQLGMLTGTAFAVLYSVSGIPLGRVADRVDRVKLIAATLVVWSGFTVVCGLTRNFLELFVARMGVGVGESGSGPAGVSLIPDFFPDEQRTSAMSFLLIGAPVGSFAGLLTGGYAASHWGWRPAFVLAGLPGFGLALLMLATMRDPRTRSQSIRREPGASFSITLRTLAMTPKFRRLATGMTCSSFLVYASGAWIPSFFIRAHGLSTAEMGFFSALTVGVGGAIGTLSSGILCDRLRQRISHMELKLLLLSFAISIPALLVTVLSATRSVALAALFLFNVFAFAWLGPTMTMIQRVVSPGSRALAIAISGASANILSLGVGIPLVGLISDALTPHFGRESIGYALAGSVVVVALVGMTAHWRALGQFGGDHRTPTEVPIA